MTLTVGATAQGSTLNQVLSSLNSQLNGTGITAGTDANGQLQFTGSTAFTVKDLGKNGTNATNLLTDYSAYSGSNPGQLVNSGNYSVDASNATGLAAGNTDNLTFTTSSGQSIAVNLTHANGATVANQISAINSATAAYGIYAVQSANGTGISFQSNNSFTVADNNNTASAGVFDNSTTGAAPNVTASGPAASNAGSSAISAINQAIQNLGLVQGSVGAGENKLQYAINLAQSQISNFSTAESQIRDANVAEEAANLTKAQVLQQSSIAAMAQANQEPQALMKLLG
jgi:flagellin